jgi:hypothetical protein
MKLLRIILMNISKIIQNFLYYLIIQKVNKKHNYHLKQKIFYFYFKYQYYTNKDQENF